MSWYTKMFGSQTPSFNISVSSTPPEIKRGLPVYENEVQGRKLERRDILVTVEGQQQKIPIGDLRAQFRGGLVPADAPVLVTNFYSQTTYYCGEGTVAEVVSAWEAAPLDDFDKQDIDRMIQEFSFPSYEVTTKATYYDLRNLYDRCDSHYRYIAAHDREFKRLTKVAAKDLVFSLDETQPGWDGTDGESRFAEEVRRRYPQLVRTEAEKKAKKERAKILRQKQEERRPLLETRNNLTNFPHKNMQIEIQNLGLMEIRAIKPAIREGTITPETLVRYRSESEWMELCDFLNDWMRHKATDRQIDYLSSLQQQHGITTPILLDCSRQEISDRISALVSS